MTTTSQNFRIFSQDGEHVATVKAELVNENLAFYNARRVLDIYGNPVGEYYAEAYDGYVAGER